MPRRAKHERAHAEAMRQFFAQGLHKTERRTGVLIFAAVAERYAEIVADAGINAKVAPHVWDQAVAALIAGIKDGPPATASWPRSSSAARCWPSTSRRAGFGQSGRVAEQAGGDLARLPVIDAVGPHVGRGREAVGHVVEGRDRGDVPDVAIGEAGAAQRARSSSSISQGSIVSLTAKSSMAR